MIDEQQNAANHPAVRTDSNHCTDRCAGTRHAPALTRLQPKRIDSADAQTWVIETGHLSGMETHRDEYQQRLVAFFDAALNGSELE